MKERVLGHRITAEASVAPGFVWVGRDSVPSDVGILVEVDT